MSQFAVFIDIDGTLIDDEQKYRPSAKYAIQQARKNGHKVFLSTGRCKAEIFDYIFDIGFDGLIGSSGGYIEVDHQVLRHLTFKDEDIQRLIEYFKENGIGYYLECNHGTFADEIYRDWFISVLKSLGNDFDSSLFEAFMSHVNWIDETTTIKEVNKISFATSKIPYDLIYKKLCDDFDVIRNTVGILEAESGEISLKGVNKAQAIEFVMNHLGLNDVKVMAIGDSENDIEMLEYANIGIAMRTGSEKIKAIADELTGSPKEDSIYDCFVKHGLIESMQ